MRLHLLCLVTAFASIFTGATAKGDDALGDPVEKQGYFSFQPPKGWNLFVHKTPFIELTYQDPSKSVLEAANIQVMAQKPSRPVEEVVAGLKREMPRKSYITDWTVV